MRINIYNEELTNEIEVVSKTVNDAEFGERTFLGFRFYLESPDVLHHGDIDDDRSAVTLWVRSDDYDAIHRLWSLAHGLAEAVVGFVQEPVEEP
jgi:hypothetical protein